MRAVLVAASMLFVAACGGRGALDAARDSLHQSERVVTDLDAKVAHGPASFGDESRARVADPAHHAGWQTLVRALADARTRLTDAEQSLDAWERDDAGDLAWRTVAPCLKAALEHVSAALRTVAAHDDASLEEAIASMHAEAIDACAERDEGQ